MEKRNPFSFIWKKSFSLATCVILIMLISSQMFFSFHDLIDNGNSTKKWYSCSVWRKCWLLYCLVLFLLWERDHSLLFEISLSPKYFPFSKIFPLWFYISASDRVTDSHSMLKCLIFSPFLNRFMWWFNIIIEWIGELNLYLTFIRF